MVVEVERVSAMRLAVSGGEMACSMTTSLGSGVWLGQGPYTSCCCKVYLIDLLAVVASRHPTCSKCIHLLALGQAQ